MSRPSLLAFVVVLAAPFASAQERRVYIACDDHTDYFWTADAVDYRKAFLQSLDFYLGLADQTESDPPDFQSRFACDCSLWLWEYERHKPAADFARLIERLRDGHISAPMNAAVVCYGGIPAEAVLRGMYYPGRLERRYGLNFDLAVAMENQTLPYGLPSLWAGSGARYSWRGICNCASKIDDAWDREHDIYWAAGPDGARVLMKWNSQLVDNTSMGGYAEAYDPGRVVDYVTDNLAFRRRYPWPVIGAFGKGWDGYETLTTEFLATARSKSRPARRVIVSNETDFFQDFEEHFGGQLPTLSKSFGNEWDLLCATMAEVSASVRRSLATLRTGEALAVLASRLDPAFMNGRRNERDRAFMDLGLYWEHDWTANGVVPKSRRAAWQRKIAGEISDYATALETDGLAALGAAVKKIGSDPTFVVFNPLSFERDDLCDLPYVPSGPVHVLDASTGREVPSQLIQDANGQHLRILASQVPSVGYRVYDVVPGAGKAWSDAGVVNGGEIRNVCCRLEVAGDGSIQSYVDKTRGHREFAASIQGFELNDLRGDGSGTVAPENVGPVSVTLLAKSSSPLTHDTRITLVRGSDLVRIDNEITQNFNHVQSWRFAFNTPVPIVHHEEVGAIATALLESRGGNYSDRNARYDWLTLNHFADITSRLDGVGVTLANLDCYFFQLGQSDVHQLDTLTPMITPLAGGSVDGIGITDQDGDSYVRERFALRTHDAYDAAAAMRTALEAEHPLVAVAAQAATDVLPPGSFSAFDCSDPDVLLWALKPAEEGIENGVIARLWNVGDAARDTVLQLHPDPIGAARVTTHVETDVGPLHVGPKGLAVRFAGQQLRTFRLLREDGPGGSVGH